MSKRKNRRRVNVFERVEPTPETLAKLVRTDWRLEMLSPDQQWACQRIQRGYELLSAGVGVKVADLMQTRGTSSVETPGEMLIEQAYRHWWSNCSGRVPRLTVILGVIVDPLSSAVVDRLNRHQKHIVSSMTGKGMKFGYVEEALDLYLHFNGRAPVDRNRGAAV